MSGPTPPPRFIPGVAEITVRATQEASQRVNVHHYQFSAVTALSVAQCLEMATNFWTAVGPSYVAATSVSVNFDSVTVRDIGAPGLNEATYNIPQPAPGARVGTATPANAASVISWRTGIAGRFGRGRTYMFGIADADAVGSQIQSAQATRLLAIATALQSFLNAGGAVGVLHALASFSHSRSITIISFIIDLLIDSQRRRLINRGN